MKKRVETTKQLQYVTEASYVGVVLVWDCSVEARKGFDSSTVQ